MPKDLFFCPNCAKTGKNLSDWIPSAKTPEKVQFHTGYISIFDTINMEGKYCKYCNGELINTEISYDDYAILKRDFNYNRELLDTMVELRKKDVVEYEIKMGELRNISQQKHALEEQNRKVPRCPICGSADLSRISEKGKTLNLMFGGIFGAEDLGKTWQCRNCGSKF